MNDDSQDKEDGWCGHRSAVVLTAVVLAAVVLTAVTLAAVTYTNSTEVTSGANVFYRGKLPQ
jgi:hypothetical protein